MERSKIGEVSPSSCRLPVVNWHAGEMDFGRGGQTTRRSYDSSYKSMTGNQTKNIHKTNKIMDQMYYVRGLEKRVAR